MYRATVSQAEVSKAMANTLGVMYSPSRYYKSANNLHDYVMMHAVNSSWTMRLYDLSKIYSDARESIIQIINKTAKLGDKKGGQLVPETNPCLEIAIAALNYSLWQFDSWEKSSFYLDSRVTLYNENMISRMASDMVRDLKHLGVFKSGCIDQILQINTSSTGLITCNDTVGYDLYADVQNGIAAAYVSIDTFQEEYNKLAREVQSHHRMMFYKYPHDNSNDEYIR